MYGASMWFRVITDFFTDTAIPYFFITICLSFFKSYIACRSLLVRLLCLSFGISIFINFSSKLLMYTSMATSLSRGLKADFGLNLFRSNSFSSFLMCHFNLNILPCASISVLSFTLSIVLEVGAKLSPFYNKDISELVRFRLDKFTTFLLTKLPCNQLSNTFAALSFTYIKLII